MNTVSVFASLVASITEILKETVIQAGDDIKPPTLYTLEEQTHEALLRIGQVIMQGLIGGQGSGLVRPTRPCGCGAQQTYHDQALPLQVMTSLGKVCLEQRAWYQCASCEATSYPLDEQVGVAPRGRMSRYLQEQCWWLLAVLPTRLAQQALVRFDWPTVAASQVREHGEALGAGVWGGTELSCAGGAEMFLRPGHIWLPSVSNRIEGFLEQVEGDRLWNRRLRRWLSRRKPEIKPH